MFHYASGHPSLAKLNKNRCWNLVVLKSDHYLFQLKIKLFRSQQTLADPVRCPWTKCQLNMIKLCPGLHFKLTHVHIILVDNVDSQGGLVRVRVHHVFRSEPCWQCWLPRWPCLWTISTKNDGVPLELSLSSLPPRWFWLSWWAWWSCCFSWSSWHWKSCHMMILSTQVYVGGAPRSGKHKSRAGKSPRLYQLVLDCGHHHHHKPA